MNWLSTKYDNTVYAMTHLSITDQIIKTELLEKKQFRLYNCFKICAALNIRGSNFSSPSSKYFYLLSIISERDALRKILKNMYISHCVECFVYLGPNCGISR